MDLLGIVRGKCDCLRDIEDAQLEDLWGSFLRFLSNITCWDIQGGTVEYSCRTHAVSLSNALCTYDCIQVQPYWKCIDLDTVAIEIRQYTAMGMNVIPLDSNYFNYDDISDRFYINIGSQLDTCNDCDVNCQNNVLVFRYNAGFDLSTPEWIDLICHYMTAYVALANDCASVNDCASANKLAIGARLTRKTVDTINYEWEVDENSKEVFFNQLMHNFYIDLLGKYALCGRDYSIKQNIFVGKDKYNDSKI